MDTFQELDTSPIKHTEEHFKMLKIVQFNNVDDTGIMSGMELKSCNDTLPTPTALIGNQMSMIPHNESEIHPCIKHGSKKLLK